MKNVALLDSVNRLFSNLRPAWFKHLILSFLFQLLSYGHRLISLFLQLRLSVFLVSGYEKQTGETIRVLFAGDKRFPVFLKHLIFRESPMIQYQGKIFIWRIKDLKKRYVDKVDAVIVSCDQFYQRFLHRDGFFVFPHMADMVLDTSKSLHELILELPHSTRQDVRKVQKEQFSFEITSDVDKLDKFYHEMYLPTLKNRVGETDTFTINLAFLRYLKELGYQIMMIMYEGKEVAGVFFRRQDDVLWLRYAGVLRGDMDLIKKGAFLAFYYLFIVYARGQKVNKLHFGGVNPFFNDGLFQYKRKWGMMVESYDLIKLVFGLQIVTESGPLKQFLIHNPFIGMNEKNELIGFVFVDKKTFSDPIRNQSEKNFQIPGVKELRFIKL